MTREYYIVTGYDKHQNKLSTNKCNDIEKIADIINYYSKDLVTSVKDLEFDVKTHSNFSHALILDDDPNYLWSIYLVK